ncbi:MAG: hypothetical protein JW814_07610 [Candidatus Krumholzibacteriota bacterium]|nr:hypothetical protein [Candidatus Krumholzibacteriota bacterium]
MLMFRKEWTSDEAERWTIHDTVTVIISPVIYVLILIGGALSALLMPLGFALLAIGIVLIFVMVKIINPKLSAISKAYEEKQKGYMEELEKKVKWEE